MRVKKDDGSEEEFGTGDVGYLHVMDNWEGTVRGNRLYREEICQAID
jgi:hypothetical protein